MKKSYQPKQNKVIEAAGGVLWIKTPSGLRLAIIHRQRYNDWTLPKGKRKQGEEWQETALREVFEETGCQAKLGNFIGSTSYSINHQMTPKVVLFWNMYAVNGCNFQPNDEVDRIKWVSPKKARKLLDYQDEREIIRNAANHNQE
jgi:8-oxo-dGTP pyrophosphatase MutT (NUDIX family)